MWYFYAVSIKEY